MPHGGAWPGARWLQDLRLRLVPTGPSARQDTLMAPSWRVVSHVALQSPSHPHGTRMAPASAAQEGVAGAWRTRGQGAWGAPRLLLAVKDEGETALRTLFL
jgi:hypothetical protein